MAAARYRLAPVMSPLIISRRTLCSAIVLIALTLLAYAPAMRGGFIWDDDDYVTANPNLRLSGGLADIWLAPRKSPQFYPLVYTSFWIEHQLWDFNAAGYHVDNILLQAVAALLLWRLLVMLEIPAAFLAACLFAIHPLQAESVLWITERKNVLCGVFYFASALCFVAWASRPSDFRSGETPKPQERQSRTLYALALLFFIGAMLSKTVACSLPAALALLLWWKNGRITARQCLALLPMFLIGVALAMGTAYLEVHHVEAVGREWAFSPADRILIAGRAVWFYVSKFLVPANQSFIYPKWTFDPRLAWQWAFPAGVVIALGVLFAMRNRWGRGPLVAALIFVGTLVPALGFFNIYPMRYSFVADHFQYHACAALCVLAAMGLQHVFRRFAYLLLPILLIPTMLRSYTLADSLRLWQDAAAKNPDSWMVHLNLARTLEERGHPHEAQVQFEQQLALAPELPETHWNMGFNFARRGELDAAMREYDAAIAIDPSFAPAWYARGRIYIQRHEADRAAVQFARAVETANTPQQRTYRAAAHAELGELFKQNRLYDRAISQYRAAVNDDPMFAKARVDLAALLAAKGRLDEATHQFNQAVEIDRALEQYRSAVLTLRRGI